MIFESTKLNPIAFRFDEDRCQDWSIWKKVAIPRIEYAATLSIEHIKQNDIHQKTWVIAGGGPTLAHFMDEIKDLGSEYSLCGINKVHDFLIKNDIIPNVHIIFETDVDDIEQALGGQPHKEVTYYISSHCHKNVFEQLKDYKCILWHPTINNTEYINTIRNIFPNETLIGGDAGYATFFRSLAIGYLLGYRSYKLYGLDSSFEDKDHIDGYNNPSLEPVIKVWAKNKTTGEMRNFKTNGSLAWQAYRFMFLCDGNLDLNVRIYGDGLLRYLHKGKYPDQYK